MKTTPLKRYSILGLALAAGIGLHGFALYYLQDLPLHYAFSSRNSWVSSSSDLEKDFSEKEIVKRNQDLEYVFHEWIQTSEDKSDLAFDLKNISADEIKTEWQSLESDVAAIPFTDSFNPDLSMKAEILESHQLFPIASLAHEHVQFIQSMNDLYSDAEPLIRSLYQSTDAPLGLVAAEPSQEVQNGPVIPIGKYETPILGDFDLQNIPAPSSAPQASVMVGNDDLEKAKKEALQHLLDSEKPLSALSQPSVSLATSGSSPFSEPNGGSQNDISGSASIASTKAFSLDAEFSPRPDGKGYLFKIAFIPKPGVAFKRIAQNYFFLIDRSHSIDPIRYEKSKAAVLKALSYLKKGDTFNILIFDDRMLRLSSQPALEP